MTPAIDACKKKGTHTFSTTEWGRDLTRKGGYKKIEFFCEVCQKQLGTIDLNVTP